MTVLLVESAPDPASVNIAQRLDEAAAWSPTEWVVEDEPVHAWDAHPDVLLARTARLHLYAEPFEEAARAAGVPFDAIVFLSRHRAASGRPSLTVHPVGNWGAAEYGGEPGRLGPAQPALQSELLRALRWHVDAGEYESEVTFEATHHGPRLATPSCFIELGSSEPQWDDAAGARVVAHALLEVLARPLPEYPVAVGVGGGHYAPRFTESVLRRRVHFGHMLPTHGLDDAGDAADALAKMREATPGCTALYLHRKQLTAAQRDAWKAAAEAQGLAVASSNDWAPLASGPSPA